MQLTFSTGLLVVFVGMAIAFVALAWEREDLHRLMITELAVTMSLALIALVATDLAEALILPGLVVGISELMALSQVYLMKEGLTAAPDRSLNIEVMRTGPPIIAAILIIYGVVLSGFSGGAVAGVGVILYFMAKGHSERFALLEAASGYAWAMWIGAFFIFMILPEYWFFAVMIAGAAILLKVMVKLSLLGTMRGDARV